MNIQLWQQIPMCQSAQYYYTKSGHEAKATICPTMEETLEKIILASFHENQSKLVSICNLCR